jgi:DNA polymerase III epsilon subunit family exonuclease
MGLFDKLFGKKQPIPDPKPEPPKPEQPKPISSSAQRTLDEISYYIPKAVEPPKHYRTFTYEEKEQMIAANPLAFKYRLERQQQSTSMNTMEWEQFKLKSKGSFTAFDLETTGLDDLDGYIVEIGAVRVRKGEMVEIYHQYVNPNIPMPADAQAVNHITDDMLIDQPFIFEVLPDVLEFIGSDILVAHNATFDFRFLAQACMNHRFKIPRKWFDSMDLKEVWPGLKNRKLQTFLDAAGIENEQAHSALGDAEALAKLTIISVNK